MAGVFDRMMNVGEKPPMAEADSSEEIKRVAEVDLAAAIIPESGDERRTHQRVRESAQELLKYGSLEESYKPNLYRIAVTNVEAMRAVLEPLDLDMGIDEVRGLIFIKVRQSGNAEDDDWAHPLVRRQRLNLEQSLLIAILRQHFIVYEQESGVGTNQAQVALDDLIPQLQVYLGDLGSDARERTRVITLLDQLKGHGLVSALDAHDRVVIRPIIAHLANPENLQALIAWLRQHLEQGGKQDEASALAPMEDME
jgi:hypothetical protein